MALTGRDQHFGYDWPTDSVIEHLAKVAATCLWTDKKGESISDLERFKKGSKTIDQEAFTANVQAILSHPTTEPKLFRSIPYVFDLLLDHRSTRFASATIGA
ncbi:hypothetical protein IFT84_08520 [Rhizobium sp. CFBP 8762]|uniref:hypothetical protein n=1 Tax=Rhizobium sp. CFBP 8762 TaxID=2775279 RepID=UPI00177ED115|nr:hypothetical protein [Rhizobium sp. CFBP 8762]MBD8554575.1 hypothetical protein [Rhizobium sp. CFBP 8762]